ncbi:hypothetical protein VTK73DRAFT_6993 [Phialemonium thermophilum]|uniref:beta-N-acetylhexosaminidase n=1 Tax=Phialemonium thermophilum TaxID=223376 RepID=A0ABR3WH16_9PEZI
MMRITQALLWGAVGLAAADAFLPGIPTVPYQTAASAGGFSLAHVQRIVVDRRYATSRDTAGQTLNPPTLFEFASLFAEDLRDALGTSAHAVKGTNRCSTGSIFLTIDEDGEYKNAAGESSSEGYTLSVDDKGIVVTGASALGVWWGTRTVLQQGLLALAESGTPSVPHGQGADVPGWRARGMMLDAGRHYYPPDFLTDLCGYMSFFKQNTLHLHLSDNLYNNQNYTRAQSLELYARFRLWSDDPAVAGLNKYANESYDRATFDAVQSSCAARGVTVLPEIEAPGHALVITQWKPELGLRTDLSLLNISHPDTIPTMKTIWRTFLPWFHSKTVSIGADEYTGPESDYNTFVNAMDGFIGTESGKSIWIWATFPPIWYVVDSRHSLTVSWYNSTWTNVYPNVHWEYFEDDPYYDYILHNYSVVNSNDDFYIVNKWAPPGGYLNTINLTRTFHGSPDGRFWRPYVFNQHNATDNPAPSNPLVLGAIAPLWNDYGANASVYSEAYYAWREGLPALADKQWGGNLSEAAFARVFGAVQPKIPAQNLERNIPSRGDVVFNYTVNHRSSSGTVHDSSPNKYTARTNCRLAHATGRSRPALSLADGCSLETPLDSKGRNYTLTLSLRLDDLADPTHATLVTGRDSALMLTPNITLLAGGNYFRLNETVPRGRWFDLAIVGRDNRTFASVDGGDEAQFLTRMGINGVYFHWAEIAIEAPVKTVGGQSSGWTGLLGGMSLTSTA